MKTACIHSISYEHLNRQAFLAVLIEKLQAVPTEKYSYIIHHEQGTGKVLSVEIEPGFEVELLQIQWQEALDINTQPALSNDKWGITICNDYVVDTNEHPYTPNAYPYCLMMSSAMTQQQIGIPANMPFLSFSIIFSQEWIAQNIIANVKPEAAEVLHSIITNNQAVWQIDNIDLDLNRILDTLLHEDLYQSSTKLLFYRTALDLTLLFFKKLINKSIFVPVQHFKKHDIQKIHQVNDWILEDLSKPCPTIEELSRSVGMSAAKFKALYKAVFNTSVYNYHLNERLEQSCKYLQSGQYTINEVAYMVGFNYPSSFSRIFKKIYGQSPNQFIGHYDSRLC